MNGHMPAPAPVPAIDAQTVVAVAKLARLPMDAKKAAIFASQLGMILEHIEKLGEVDVSAVEPLTHPVEPPELRADVARVIDPKLGEGILSSAPELAGSGYKVPPIL